MTVNGLPLVSRAEAPCVAALLLFASSGCTDVWIDFASGPVLSNAAYVHETLSVYTVDEVIACDRVLELASDGSALSFGVPRRTELFFSDVIGLDERFAATEGPSNPRWGNAPECGAAKVEGAHFDPVLITWDLRELGGQNGWDAVERGQAPPGNVMLERWGDHLLLVPGKGMFVVPVAERFGATE